MNFPKFMTRQTGGLAVGAISTKSRPASFALAKASAMGTTPRASPASPISRTSFQRICSLTRMLFLSILHLRDHFPLLSFDGSMRRRGELRDGHRAGVSPMAQAHGHGPGLRLLLPHHQHAGHLGQLPFADAGAELLVLVVHLDAQAGRRELCSD